MTWLFQDFPDEELLLAYLPVASWPLRLATGGINRPFIRQAGMRIRNSKEFYAGLIFFSFGVLAVLLAHGLPMGTAMRMGPGYFPTMLGGLLTLVGVVSMIRSFLHQGERIAAFSWKEIVLVLGSVVLFGVLVRGAGLVPSLIVLVVTSASASEKFRIRTALLLAVLTSVFSALVFVKGLGLPFALVGRWFAN